MVYGSGLENQRVCKGTVGSNPTLSVQSVSKAQSLAGFFNVLKKPCGVFLGIHGAASAVFRTDFEQEELLAAPNEALKSVDMKGLARLRQVKEPERIARSVSS